MDLSDSPISKRNVLVDGRKLRSLRETLRLTQQDAAKLSGYSARLIRKLESGGSVSRDTLENIITAYQEARSRGFENCLLGVLRPIDFIVCALQDSVQQVAFDWFDRVFNHRDLSAVDDLVHPEITLIAEGQTLRGQEPVRARLQAILDGFNPLRLSIEHLFSDGHTAIVYWQVDATHTGEFFGIAPTSREISIRGTTMAVITGGKFLEARDHWDAKELIDQIS